MEKILKITLSNIIVKALIIRLAHCQLHYNVKNNTSLNTTVPPYSEMKMGNNFFIDTSAKTIQSISNKNTDFTKTSKSLLKETVPDNPREPLKEFISITTNKNLFQLDEIALSTLSYLKTEQIIAFTHQNPIVTDDQIAVQSNKRILEYQSTRPKDCSHREKNHRQPVQTSTSRLKKCCPLGETLVTDEKNIDTQYCDTERHTYKQSIIKAELFENCIEDTEEPVTLEYEVGNPCNISFIYGSNSNEKLFVLQDGSLLIMDEYANDSYFIEESYCLDTDRYTGNVFAIVCVSSIVNHLGSGQTILYAAFMMVSIPCLLIVSFLHISIKELRTVHGLSLSVMSICLAVGFFLHSVAQIGDYSRSAIGYAVQFFMLAYFCWLFSLCWNVSVHVWYYLPRNKIITTPIRYVHFTIYAIISFCIPLMLVLITRHKGLPGMPSYFFQGFTDSIRESQRYFIPPVTFVLLLSFFLLVASFFGFRSMEKIIDKQFEEHYAAVYHAIKTNSLDIPRVDREGYEEMRKDAKCLSFLGLIIITTWIFEVVTFYSPGPEDYLAFMEMVNGIQGVFILMIFIIIRQRRTIIIRWWRDRGSHLITDVEMTEVQTPI